MQSFINLSVILLLTVLSACASEIPRIVSKDDALYKACKNPRPQICTREYRPVCGTRDTGIRCLTTPCASTERKTYGNACTACADSTVIEYRSGKCLVPKLTSQ